MSALRLGRLPDGSRDVRVIDDGATGRIHTTRYGLRGGGPPVVAGNHIDQKAKSKQTRREERGLVESTGG